MDIGFTANMRDLANLITHSYNGTIDVLGTSMGGILGILIAAQPDIPVRKLILNDVGPLVPGELSLALSHFEQNKPLSFTTLEEAVEYHQKYNRSFGPMSDDQWIQFTLSGLKQNPSGDYVYDYDDFVKQSIIADTHEHDVEFWDRWLEVSCPVLILRGEKSMALTHETCQRMQADGPALTIVEFPESGHAPHLLSDEQIAPISSWLLE